MSLTPHEGEPAGSHEPTYTRLGVPQWGTADEEIKDPSVENPELKGSTFKA